MQEVTILMPCLNEATTIENCIRNAKAFLEKENLDGEVLVVDNGSTDASAALAKKAGARVMKESQKGYGNALRAGIKASKAKYIIMGDADESYDFGESGPILAKLREGCDLVVGNRFRGEMEPGAMPFMHRVVGNPVLSFLGRLLYPCPVHDFHCGLRGINRERLEKLPFQASGMEFASEMIILCKLKNYRIAEVPVSLKKDGRTGRSHLRSVRDGLRHLGVLIGYRRILSYLLTFLLTVFVCAGLLTAVDAIPGKYVEKQMKASASYFANRPLFDSMIPGHHFTRIDHYADCILTNIVYTMDETHPFSASVRACYYSDPYEEVNVNFLNAVNGIPLDKQDYFRYWHGSMVILRPLFMLFDIVGVRAVLFLLFCLLSTAILCKLIKSRFYGPAAILSLSLLAVQVWVTAFCIEYITTFLVMAAVLFVVVCKSEAGRIGQWNREAEERFYIRLFIISGVVTCFVDFLTTETITITMPLLLLLLLRQEKEELLNLKTEFLFAVKSLVAWGISYSGMFLTKWGISAMVLGPDAMRSALSEARFRMAGEVTSDNSNLGRVLGIMEQLSGTIWKNLQQLFCLSVDSSERMVYAIAFGVLAVVFVVWYLFRKDHVNGQFILMLLFLGVLPYLRYPVLRNHSYLHYFFTYRAQVVSVASIFAILWYSTGSKKKT